MFDDGFAAAGPLISDSPCTQESPSVQPWRYCCRTYSGSVPTWGQLRRLGAESTLDATVVI